MLNDEPDQSYGILQSLEVLLRIAENIGRNNASKWRYSFVDWQAAVNAVLTAPDANSDDEIAEARRTTLASVRRLGNSGEARFGSATVGRDPDSSMTGRRFRSDIETVQCRFEVLRELIQRRTGRST